MPDNACVAAGRVNNTVATVTGIIVDAREPPDDPTKPVWLLRSPPAAVIVRPSAVDVGALCDGPGAGRDTHLR